MTTSLIVGRQLTDSLLDQNPDTGEIVPWLASEWDVSDDLTSYTFTLRDGVTFSDGTPLTSDVVAANFDAIVALYSLIHLPIARQPEVIASCERWTRLGGLLLLVAGARAWTGTEDDWLGGGATMWWSHPDADGYRGWLAAAGWDVTDEQFVPEGSSGHQVFWARRRVASES